MSPRPRERLSAAQARRVALWAQGFADGLRDKAPDGWALRKVLSRIGLLQIDSVNVLQRAHYLPLFARLGPYDTDMLERVLEIVGERGAVAASEIAATEGDQRRRSGPWWNWSHTKRALEFLFWSGRVTSARRRGFERLYDLPERVLPRAVVETPTPEVADAQRELVRIAARALGVATERDLRDYFRLPVADARARVAELVEGGELAPVQVEGWGQAAYVDPGAKLPRSVDARALVGPFDSLV